MLQQFWQPSQRLVLQLVDGRFGAKAKEKFLGFTGGNPAAQFLCWLKIESCGSTNPFAVSAAASARQ